MENEKLNQLLDFLLETLKQTKDFTLEQSPIVVQEVLSFGIWSAQMGLIIGLILLPVPLICFLVFKYRVSKYDGASWSAPEPVIEFIVGAVCLILGLASITCSIYTLNKIEKAPRLYLIEQIQKKS